MAIVAHTDSSNNLFIQLCDQNPSRRSSLKEGDILLRVVVWNQKSAFIPQCNTCLHLACAQVVNIR